MIKGMKIDYKSLLGVFYKRLIFLYSIVQKIYYVYERLMIMYVPFISSIIYCISVYLFIIHQNNSLYSRYNNNLAGHSIFWLQIILSRSKNMCIWYKGAIVLSMFTHVLNILYYHLSFDRHLYIAASLAIAILSIISWLIFRVTYKTTKVVHSACTRLEELEKSQSHTSS